MRNLKKCISLILVMLLMSLQISVFAESKIEDVKIEYDRETGDVTVSGKAPFAGNLEEPARLLILKPGTNADDLISGKVTYPEVGIHVDETDVSSDKSFIFETVTFPDTLTVGDYIVRIAVEDVTYSGVFSFATAKQTLDMMNNVSDADTIEKNIEKYNDVYGLDIAEGSDFANLSSDGQNFVLESMCGREYDEPDEIKEIFDVSTQLYRIKEGPWGVVKSVIKTHAELLGLDLDDYESLSDSGKTDICKALVGNLFADADALNDALDEAVSDYNEADKKSDKGSSGSGGRDSGSSDVSMQVVKDTEKEDIKEPETNEPFGDLENHSWAKDSIYELYNNGIVNGKAEGIFAPNDSITRAEAVKMIILALSEVNSEAECSFSDVNVGSWMYPFVATAATKGIVNGYSNEYFGADDAVTREDFAVIIVRAAEAIGSEFDAEGVTFADSEEIADYALEAVYKLKRAGIINGAGENQFMPKAFATRAEAAKIIAALVD